MNFYNPDGSKRSACVRFHPAGNAKKGEMLEKRTKLTINVLEKQISSAISIDFILKTGGGNFIEMSEAVSVFARAKNNMSCCCAFHH